MTDSNPLLVNCGPHGMRVSAVVCKHLVPPDSDPAGFVENSDDPDDLQAWCHGCEAKFDQEGGMTESFLEFNGMAIVCIDCYGEAKSRHSGPDSE